MMEKAVMTLEKRQLSSKGALNQFRREGKIPGVLYGTHQKATPIVVNEKELRQALGSGHSILEAKLGRSKKKVVIREIQRHPYREHILHVDLLAVTLGEKLTLTVPIHLVGTPHGVKDEGGTLHHDLHELEIECLPREAPETVEVDVSNLGLGQSLHVSDLKLQNVTALTREDALIATVFAPRVKEEVAVPTIGEEEEIEPEAVGRKAEEAAKSEEES